MQISGIFTYFFGLSLYSGQAAKCSRIGPPVQGLDATSVQKPAEAMQEHKEVVQDHAEVVHEYNEAVQEHADVVHKYNKAGHKLDTLGGAFVNSLCMFLHRLCHILEHLAACPE